LIVNEMKGKLGRQTPVTVEIRRYTIAEFEHFVAQPENVDKLFVYSGGEIVEVVSNAYASAVASRISYWISHYVLLDL